MATFIVLEVRFFQWVHFPSGPRSRSSFLTMPFEKYFAFKILQVKELKFPICNGKEDTTEHVLECQTAETVYRIKDNH